MNSVRFKQLNPVITETFDQYETMKQAYLVQGEFLKTHTFIFYDFDQRQVEVLKLRCGLIDGRCWTLQEIAERLNLSRERVRQLEINIFNRLRHPHRIELLQKYDDFTFDETEVQSFYYEQESLIKQDIMYNILFKNIKYFKDVKIHDLKISTHNISVEKAENIKKHLIDNGITTCKQLVEYMHENGELPNMKFSKQINNAIMYAICQIIDSKNKGLECRKTFRACIEQEKESVRLLKVEKKKIDSLETKAKQIRLQNASVKPEDVLVEDLQLDQKFIKILKAMGLNSVKDIVDYYNNNNYTLLTPKYIGNALERNIMGQLELLNIELIPNIEENRRKLLTQPQNLPIEHLNLSLRLYNCLKRHQINTVEELINYYIDNKMSLQTMRNLGVGGERDILDKLAEFGVDFSVLSLAK